MTLEFDLTRDAMTQTFRIAVVIAGLWEAGEPAMLETVMEGFVAFQRDDPIEDQISKARIIELWPHALDLAIDCAHMHGFDIPVTIPELSTPSKRGRI